MQLNLRAPAIGLVLILATSFSMISKAQTAEMLKSSNSENLTQEDYLAMMDLNKMKVYKFPVKIPEEQKCIVKLYKQEYEFEKKIKDENIFGSHSPHKKVVDRKRVLNDDGEPVYTPLDGIRIISKEEDKDFTLGFRFGEIEIPYMPVVIDSVYSEKHYARSFAIPEEFPIGSEIPLVLIGSSWESTDISGDSQTTKFCIAEEVSPDFSREQFKKMPHYIVFGIRVVEPR